MRRKTTAKVFQKPPTTLAHLISFKFYGDTDGNLMYILRIHSSNDARGDPLNRLCEIPEIFRITSISTFFSSSNKGYTEPSQITYQKLSMSYFYFKTNWGENLQLKLFRILAQLFRILLRSNFTAISTETFGMYWSYIPVMMLGKILRIFCGRFWKFFASSTFCRYLKRDFTQSCLIISGHIIISSLPTTKFR